MLALVALMISVSEAVVSAIRLFRGNEVYHFKSIILGADTINIFECCKSHDD